MSQKSRKIRAIAAGGAVLGVGAAITLAAWSDNEFAEGFFNTQRFGIEAATDGINFDSHSDAGNALELVAQDVPATMVPGVPQSFPYQIKNVDNGADSTVTYIDGVVNSELGELFTTSVHQVDNAEACTPTLTGPGLPIGESFDLVDQEIENLCILVSLEAGEDLPTAPQDMSIVWQFDAAQLDPAAPAGPGV